ncbi:LacI family DNA-binding transcriptional regulator [Microbacterium sp. Re1]|uniref:LacI family DNA-binding transcriptional regulator n=1 Tax=Microbacterium commune TaxID=2762219 RepID=A0ABR8W554_9MICO|nr:LacI family DNA-binding transcriptional regulator [Microbacterium commune]MBD8012138.1 LacI family DNA-binding transcriptional regulator [Microbacterium commune]
MDSSETDAPPAPATSPARASMHDVAALAGVSHMTVSRALNGYPNMRDETRRRVLDAVEQLNFTRSPIARALVTKRSMRIGVLLHGQVNHGPNTTLRAFERAARRHGYAVTSVSIDDDDQRPLDIGVMELVTQGVDAVGIIAMRPTSLARVRKYTVGLPVIVEMDEPQEGLLNAAYDQTQGTERAVEHLIGLGHRSIRHLAGPLDWHVAQARAAAWESTLARNGLPVVAPTEGDWSSDSGYAYARDADLGDATAIFVANDQMALGVLHGLHERGLRVPEDISVVGFDDVPESRHFSPPLTTVRQDFTELGELMLTDLLAALEGRPSPDHGLLESTLIVRESTAPASPRDR